MNFPKYIDNRYQELAVKQEVLQSQDPDAFPVAVDAEQKAAHHLLTSYRTFLKWVLMLKVIAGFFGMKLKLTRKPTSPMLDRLREQQKQKTEQQALAKGPQLVANVTQESSSTPAS